MRVLLRFVEVKGLPEMWREVDLPFAPIGEFFLEFDDEFCLKLNSTTVPLWKHQEQRFHCWCETDDDLGDDPLEFLRSYGFRPFDE